MLDWVRRTAFPLAEAGATVLTLLVAAIGVLAVPADQIAPFWRLWGAAAGAGIAFTAVLWRWRNREMQRTAAHAKPRLVATIQAASYSRIQEPDSYLICMEVQVQETNGVAVGVRDWETRLWFDDAEVIGRTFDPPRGWRGYAIHRNKPVQQSLRNQGQVPGRGEIVGIVPATFYHVPFEHFSDVTLGVRVRGVGDDANWTDWHTFSPAADPTHDLDVSEIHRLY